MQVNCMHKATCLASLWLIPPEGQADMRVTLNIYVRHERRIRAKQTRIERRPDVAEATKTVAWLQIFMGMTTSFVPKFQRVHARHQKKEKHSGHGDQTRKNTLYQGRGRGRYTLLASGLVPSRLAGVVIGTQHADVFGHGLRHRLRNLRARSRYK